MTDNARIRGSWYCWKTRTRQANTPTEAAHLRTHIDRLGMPALPPPALAAK